jgi:RHS repeat-associated protein
VFGTWTDTPIASGWPIWQGAFAPFGQEVSPQMTTNNYRFTGDEHDSDSNTEHTQFRQLATTQGRWLSPDPWLGSIDLTNPQSFNRYAYVSNNPVAYVDPGGLNEAAPGDPVTCRAEEMEIPCQFAIGDALGFGASIFDIGLAAFTPTAALVVPDPEFIATGNSLLVPVYGNWDLISAFGQVIWSPWYRVLGTLEGQGKEGEIHLNNSTSYGFNPQTDVFVALPDNTLKRQCVDISANGHYASGVPVGDVGPINGGGTNSNIEKFNDPYWSPGGSRGGGFQQPLTSEGVHFRPSRTQFARGTGIDISFPLQQQLGLKGNTTVNWRFASCH